MESARLLSSTSSPTSVRAEDSTTTHSKNGHLFQMVGNQALGFSSISGAFPMISHPAFSLFSSSPVRSEFGGLGMLGMSSALAARSQPGALPDWWRSADAQGQGSAAFFPHLLALPAFFSSPPLNQEQTLLQPHAPRHIPAKGLNGSINGKAISSSASSTPSPDQTKSLKTSAKPALNQQQEKPRHKTEDKKHGSKVADVSINSDSQSASSSDSSSDALSSSDLDDLEDDEDDDDDDDDDEDQSDDSEDSEKSRNHPNGVRKEHMVTDRRNHHHILGKETEDLRSSSQMPTHIQAFRSKEDPNKLIQTTAKPLALVTERSRDRDAASQKEPRNTSHSSCPKPASSSPSYLDHTTFSKLKQPSLPQAFPPAQKRPYGGPLASSHSSAVQDAPLALITKPRSLDNAPINLCTTSPRAGLQTPMRGTTPLVESSKGAESANKSSDDSLMEDEDEIDVSNDSLSDLDSNLDSDSDDDDDDDDGDNGKEEEMDTDLEMDTTPLKLTKSSTSAPDSSHSSSPAPLDLHVHKTPVTSTPTPVTSSEISTNHSPAFSSYSVATPPGKRRRVTDECALRKPLEYGWRRETRITSTSGRLRGEVAYFAPCGRKIRQYPDVIKYLSRNGISDITRDHFSFSAKIKVGDFYEARDGPQGLQWCLLKEEEVAPRIVMLEGRRASLKNLDSSRSRRKHQTPDETETHVLNSSEAKLLRKLEAQEIARQVAQMKLMRKLEKQALARAAKEARRQQAIVVAEERRKLKEQKKILKQQEKFKRTQQVRMEKEIRARQIFEAKRKKKEEAANAKILEAEKRIKEKELRRQQTIILKHQELERHRLDMERERRRQHVMLMKAMEAKKKAEEKERLKQEKRDEKRLNKERKLELRRLELEMAKELNKPNEDLCLSDHKPLLGLSRVAGLLLPASCFSDCLMVLQFLRCFGTALGLDLSTDVPSLGELQAGLLNVGHGAGLILDLLVRLLSAAVCDPGLPPGQRARTALGDHVTAVGLNRDNVSEVLQIYMEAQCRRTALEPVAESLKTRAFQTHTPAQKASILAFLVNELCCSRSVVAEIDKNIDSMTNLRRDKWVIEGNLRKLRNVYAKRTGKRESSAGGEETQTPVNSRKRKRKGGESEDEEDDDEDSDEQEDEEEDIYAGKKGKKAEACEEEDEGDQTTSIEELERQIEKLSKQQTQVRRRLFEASHSLRSGVLGQDRYRRRYWALPQCGGIFVEALESGEGPEELQRERERTKNTLVQIKQEPLEENHASAEVKHEPGQDVSSLNLFLQRPGKLGELLEVARMASDISRPPKLPSVLPSIHSDGSGLLSNAQLYRVLTETSAQWFSVLPRAPCDESSLSGRTHPERTASSGGIRNSSQTDLRMKAGVPLLDLPLCVWADGSVGPNVAFPGLSMSQILSEGSGNRSVPKSESPEKLLSAPSPKNQDYSTPQPIPEEMLTGWWKVTDMEELRCIERACHPRGIREKQLQKQLQKHMQYIGPQCWRNRDVAGIDLSQLQELGLSQDAVSSWSVEDQAMDTDISVLQQVEELENRVISASLQVKGWRPPAPQSQSEELVYYQHKPAEGAGAAIERRDNNPLDIAVSRLSTLERNLERRYLKSPMSSTVHIRLDSTGAPAVPSPAGAEGDGPGQDVSPGLRQWRRAVSEAVSSSRLALCLQQLSRSIAWDRSILRVFCQMCCKGDSEDLLLLCDGCERGCHTYCHRPRISSIPDGDWFCPACRAQASGQTLKTQKPSNRSSGGLKKAAEAKRHRKPSVTRDSDEESARKLTKEVKKSLSSKPESPACVKKPRSSQNDSRDLALCRLLLVELERHEDAGPFLTPVNPRSVPGYRKIIRRPMDFSTIRDKLNNSQYLNLETFIIDVNLVFDNCEKFNEDNSVIGRAGHALRSFFQRRWRELLNS